MPKSRQRCVTSLSSSSKEPSSSSNSIRSRAESLPSLCCRSRRSAPPPASAAACRRRNSSSLVICTTVAHRKEGDPFKYILRDGVSPNILPYNSTKGESHYGKGYGSQKGNQEAEE